MAWSGHSFPGQSKAGDRLRPTYPRDLCPTRQLWDPLGWHQPQAALGECGAGAEPWMSIVGAEGQTLPWKGKAKPKQKP